tara:strand:+ start:652 stop:819 length:168 start_codon:yes stop_codon:yes gene_type:complete
MSDRGGMVTAKERVAGSQVSSTEKDRGEQGGSKLWKGLERSKQMELGENEPYTLE